MLKCALFWTWDLSVTHMNPQKYSFHIFSTLSNIQGSSEQNKNIRGTHNILRLIASKDQDCGVSEGGETDK